MPVVCPRRCLAFLILAVLSAAPLCAQTYVAGQTYFGRNNYIEYHAGNMPVIVAAPHGGSLTPAELPDRTSGTTTMDANTEDLARRIQTAFTNRFGRIPHVVLCRLHREKIDCNREIVEGAQGHALTEISWNDFQNFLIAARQTVTAQFGRGLFLDIHGHGHTLQRLELGYLIDAAELDLSDAALEASTSVVNSSIRNLDVRSPFTAVQLLRGANSLGGLLTVRGYPSVPSPTIPTPGTDPYFNGGYNTLEHGSRSSGTVSAVQMECNYTDVRDTTTNRTAFATELAGAIETYFTEHFTLNLYDAPPGLTALTALAIDEDTATGARAFTVSDAETAVASLTLERASSDTVLVPLAGIAFGGNGANRTVTVTPAANRFGTATITVTVVDANGGRARESFVLTVNAVNDPPAISNVTSKTVLEDTPTAAIPFSIGDPDHAASSLVMGGTSSNQTLVPNANIVFGGSGTSRTVTVTPAPNRNGSATITLTVSDGTLTDTDTFTLTVTPDAPIADWQQANFGANWNNPAISGDLVDGDEDGLVNLLEYALGGDPNVVSAAPFPQASVLGGRLAITFTRLPANTDLTMFVQGADAPAGPWADLARSVAGGACTALLGGVSVAETGAGATRTVEVRDLYPLTDPMHPRRLLRVMVVR